MVLAAFFDSGGLNAGHAVRDRLDAGERDRAACERLEQQQDAERLGPERDGARLARDGAALAE